jgi:hypothetical protein
MEFLYTVEADFRYTKCDYCGKRILFTEGHLIQDGILICRECNNELKENQDA